MERSQQTHFSERASAWTRWWRAAVEVAGPVVRRERDASAHFGAEAGHGRPEHRRKERQPWRTRTRSFGSGDGSDAEVGVRGLASRLKTGSGRASVRRQSELSRNVARWFESRCARRTAGFGLQANLAWRGRGAETDGVSVLNPGCFGIRGKGQEARPTARGVRDRQKGKTGASPAEPEAGPGAGGGRRCGNGSAASVAGAGRQSKQPAVLRQQDSGPTSVGEGPAVETLRGGERRWRVKAPGRSSPSESGCGQRVSARFAWKVRVCSTKGERETPGRHRPLRDGTAPREEKALKGETPRTLLA